MRTLLSINNYHYRRGGAEVVHLEHMRLFADHGWNAIPFSMRHVRNEPSEWDRYFVDTIEFGEDYDAMSRLRMAGKVIYSFEARNKLSSLLERADVSVAHAHNVYHHISPSIFSTLRAHGVPTALTLHDLKLACPAYKMLTHDGICERCRGGRIHNVVVHRCMKGSVALSALIALESAVHKALGSYSRNVDRLVVPSRFLLEKMVEWGWDRTRFTYVPNFVDTGRVVADSDVGSRFVYVGRIVRDKGVETLIRAAAAARVPLCLVGTGPDDDEMRALAARLGGQTEFLGFRSGTDLDAALRSSLAVVTPSELYENAPMSVLEAYAVGRPVIGARIGGIPELVREGETGITFASRDVEDLSRALSSMAALPAAHLASMGAAGRHWVEQNFTLDLYRDRMLELYASMGVRTQ